MFEAIKHSVRKKITWNKPSKGSSSEKKREAHKAEAKPDIKAAISRPLPQIVAADSFEHAQTLTFSDSTPSLHSGGVSGASTEVNTPESCRTPNGSRQRRQGLYGAIEFASPTYAGPSSSPPPPRRPAANTSPALAVPATGNQSQADRAKRRQEISNSGTFGRQEPTDTKISASPSINSMSSTDSYRDLTVTTHSAERMQFKRMAGTLINVPRTVRESPSVDSDSDVASTRSIDTFSSFGDVPPRQYR